ncbi:MAG TPA: C25 family cysteine peptidase [Planctomycetota bacterium]|nr:C25 family cysteine peptidase [Planctomycetota bacterium]
MNSVTFQGSMPTLGPTYPQVSTATNTLNSAISTMLVNQISPVGKKLTCTGTNTNAANANSNVVSTVTGYVPATGTILFNPPILAPFLAGGTGDTFTLDFQTTSVTSATSINALCLAPYGGASSVLAGQTIAMTSGNAIGSGAVISSIDASGNVTLAGTGFATLPGAGDSFQVCSGQVSGSVTSGPAGNSFTATALAVLGGPNCVLNGQTIIMTSGTQAGRSTIITSVTTAGLVTLAQALPAAPGVGDAFVINGASNAITGATTLTVASGAIAVTPFPGTSGSGIGLRAEFYGLGAGTNFTNLGANRIDGSLNNTVSATAGFTYDPDAFGPITNTNDSAIFTGFIIPDYTEQYIFQTNDIDDGERVYIGGQMVIDAMGASGNIGAGTMNLTAGVRYPIRVEFFNQGGGSAYSLLWNSANQTSGLAAVVPAGNLVPAANNAVVACNLNFGSIKGALTNNGAGTLQIGTLGLPLSSGVISGSNGLDIVSNGTVSLYAANTYTGATNLGSGFVQAGNSSAFSAGTVTIQQNVHLMGALGNSAFSVILANPFTLAGDFYIGNSPNQITFTNTLTLTANRIVSFDSYFSSNAASTANLAICNINGPIVDGGNGYSFAKAGVGFVQMNSTSTYGGPTIIYRGTMTLGTSNALPTTNNIVVAGRTLSTGTSYLGIFALNPPNQAATLNLNGFNQTCTGIYLGYNDIYNLPALAADSVITSTNAGTLTVNVSADTDGIRDRYLGILTGSITLVKTGPGSLGLYNACTYTGQTIVNTGTLLEGINGGIPATSSVIVNAAGTVDNNGTVSTIGNSGATLTINNGAVVNNTPGGQLTLGGDVYATGTLGHIDGNILIAANTTRQFFVNNAADTLTLNAELNGSGGSTINKLGAGTLTLTSGESPFPGVVLINAGTLDLAGSTAALQGVTSMQVNNGTLLIDATNTAAGANPNRLYDQMALSMNGGTLKMLAPLNVTRTETIGLINFTGGNSSIVLQANGTGDSQFIAAAFTRSNGATFTLDRSNAVAGAGLETGNLFFANPSPLTNNGNVPFALVTDNSASPSPVINSPAIYTTLNGVVEGGPIVGGTLYISNGSGGGDWNTIGTWKDINGAIIATVDATHPGQAGDLVRIVAADTVTLNQNNVIDEVEFTANGQLKNGTGSHTLTFNGASTSLNQILVSGAGSPSIGVNLSVAGDFLINNVQSSSTLTISGVVSNGATSGSPPVVWYKFEEQAPATVVNAAGTITGAPAALAPTAESEAANVVTVTVANTLVAGQNVTISGTNVGGYNGDYVVASAVAASFTYNNPTAGIAAGTTPFGSVTVNNVTGSGTQFGSAINAGDLITIGQGTAANAQAVLVTAISSPTTAQTFYPLIGAAGSAFSYITNPRTSGAGQLGAAAIGALTVTGINNTQFGTQVVIGDYIVIGTGTTQQCVVITGINTATQTLTISPGFAQAVAASSNYMYVHPNGGTIVNSSPAGSAYNGTLQNATGGASLYYGPGALGTSALFSGSTASGTNTANVDGYVEVPNFNWPAGSPVSISFWAFTPGVSPQEWTFGVGSDGTQRFSCHIGFGDQQISWDYGDIANGGRIQSAAGFIGGTAMPFNTWNHVAFVAGGATSPYRAIYVNGLLVTSNFAGNSGPISNLQTLEIFRSLVTPANTHNRGGIDDFRIYNRVLGPNEIATLYSKQEPQNATITKTGPGTLVLSGTNTFSSSLNIDAGVLSVSNDANLSTATTNFPLIGSVASNNVVSSVSAATEATNTVTVTTAANHLLVVGQSVTIAGMFPNEYNGTFVVQTVPSATTFTYSDPVANLAAASTLGTVTPANSAIAGTNTSFTSQLNIGDVVTVAGATPVSATIVQVFSATSILTSPAFTNSVTGAAMSVARSPQVGLNGGTLLASGTFATSASRPFSINSPTLATSIDAAAGQTLTVNGPMVGGSMSFNSLPTSTGTVFVQSNNGALRQGQSHVNGGTLRVPTVSANPPISAMGSSQIFVNNGSTLELFSNTIVGNGTISIPANSTAVTGTNTNFTTQYAVNDQLFAYDDTGILTAVNIAAITDDTHLTLTGNFSGNTATNKAHDAVRNIGGSFASTYNFANAVFLNNNAVVQGTGNMPNGSGNTTGIFTIADGANVTIQTSSNVLDVLRMATADFLRGGGNGSSITFGGGGRVQFLNDNPTQFYTGNINVNFTVVNPATNNVTAGLLVSNATSTSNVANVITITSGYFGVNQGAAATIAVPNPIVLNGGTLAGNLTINNANFTCSGPISVNANSVLGLSALNNVNVTVFLDLTGVISGTGGLTIAGKINAQGFVRWFNPASTYSGTITCATTNATLELRPANSAPVAGPPANIVVTAGQLNLRSDNNTQFLESLTVPSGVTSTINVDRQGNNSFQNQQMTNLTINGGGTLNWTSGDSNSLSFTGTISTAGGTGTITSAVAGPTVFFGLGGSFSGTGTLNLNGTANPAYTFYGTGGNAPGLTINANAGTVNITGNGSNGASPLNINSTVSAGTITGSTGSGLLSLNSGVTSVKGIAGVVGGPVSVNSGGTLALDNSQGARNNRITFSPLTLAGGTMTINNFPGTLITENFNTLVLATGTSSTLTMTPTGSGGDIQVTVATLSRGLGAFLALNRLGSPTPSDANLFVTGTTQGTSFPYITVTQLAPTASVGAGFYDAVTPLGIVAPPGGISYASVKSGNWDDQTVWLPIPPAGGPTASDTITINAGHSIDLNGADRPITTINFNTGSLGGNALTSTTNTVIVSASINVSGAASNGLKGDYYDTPIQNTNGSLRFVTNKQLGGSSATLTMTGNHLIPTGQGVRVALNPPDPAFDGVYTVQGNGANTNILAYNSNLNGTVNSAITQGTAFGVFGVTNKVLSGGTVTLTTAAAHGLRATQSIAVTLGDPTYDGTYNLTVASGSILSYTKAGADSASASTNFNVTNKALTSNVATLTIGTHGFSTGQAIQVTLGDAAFDGFYAISGVTSTTVSYFHINPDVASSATTGTLNGTCQIVPDNSRIDPQVYFGFANPAISGLTNTNDYSVRWTGFVEAPYTDTYTFFTHGDDGSRVVVTPIGGASVMVTSNDYNTGHGINEVSAGVGGSTLALTAGQRVAIDHIYEQGNGGTGIALLWASPTMGKQVIPQSALTADGLVTISAAISFGTNTALIANNGSGVVNITSTITGSNGMELGGGRNGTTGKVYLLADNTATLTGTTTITSGKVKLNGAGGTGSTNVVVSGGELGGTGTVAGAVTFANAAIAQIGPGDTGVGTLTLSNGMTLSANSVCNFEVGAAGASDLLACTGNVVLNGTLNIVPQPGLGVGSYTIMTTTGGTFSGNFASIPARGAYNFTATVNPASVVLNVTAPTPQSYTWTFAGGTSGAANTPAGVEAITTANPLGLRSPGLWSTAGDWQGGLIPVGSCGTTLNFNQNLAAYFSRMDINGSGQGSAFPLTPFVLNSANLSNTTAASVILWGALHFQANGATLPVITQNAGSTQNFTFYTNLFADSNLTFAGAGSGIVFVGTGFSGGANSIASAGTAVTGTGTGFGNNNNVYVGDTLIAVSGAGVPGTGIASQQRKVVAIASTTALTVDSAFTPDLPAGTFFVWARSSEGLLRGAGSVTFNNSYTTGIFGPNDFSGGSNLLAGTVAIGNGSALGSGTVTLQGGNLRSSTQLAGANYALFNPVTVAGDSSLQVGGTGVTLTLAGPVTIPGATVTRTLTTGGSAADNTLITGVIGDGGGVNGLIKAGTGPLTLTGLNTYTGITQISAGTLILATQPIGPCVASTTIVVGDGVGGANADVLQIGGAAEVLPAAAIKINGSSGKFDIQQFSTTVGSISDTGTVTAGGSSVNVGAAGAGATLIFGDATNQTFSGVFTGSNPGAATNTIQYQGTGTMTLAGASTYGGNNNVALVQSGTLVVSSGATFTPVQVTVQTLGTAATGTVYMVNGTSGTIQLLDSLNATNAQGGTQLRGTGIVGDVNTNDTTGNNNTVVWPGVAAKPSLLNANEVLTANSVSLLNGGKLAFVINAANTASQQVICNGAFNVDSSSTLSFTVDSTHNTKTFKVIDTGFNSNVTQSFSNVIGKAGTSVLARGASNTGGGGDYDIIYRDTLTPNPDIINPAFGGVLINPVNQVLIRFSNTNVTPVTVDAFNARPEGAGVLVSWLSVSEYQNAGFNVYRRNAGFQPAGSRRSIGGWTRVNSALIPGRITNADFKLYTLYDWTDAGQYEYKLESLSIKGEVETHAQLAGPVEIGSAFSQFAALTPEALNAVVSGIEFDAQTLRGQTLSDKFLAQAASFVLPPLGGTAPAPSTAVAQSTPLPPKGGTAYTPLAHTDNGALFLPATVRAIDAASVVPPSGGIASAASTTSTRSTPVPPKGGTTNVSARWFTAGGASASSFTGVKVLYDKPGVLLIPQAQLPGGAGSGGGFDINHVSIQREGRSLTPLALTADGLIVYGQGYQDDYTNKDALFLRRIAGKTAAGQVMQAQGLFAPTVTVNTDTPATVTADYHDVYFDYTLRPYTYAPWFSSQYLTGGTTQSFSIDTPFASAGAATLTVNLWSLTQSDTVSPDHALQVAINGQPAGQAQWTGGGMMMEITFQVPSGVLNAGTNQIDMITPNIDGVDSEISFLHSMTIGYTRLLDGSQQVQLFNGGSSQKTYELSNMPSANAWVVDARYADRAALVPSQSELQADGTYTLRFSAGAGGTGQYLVVPAGMENTPVAISKRAIKPIRNSGTYLAVGPNQFAPALQPLLMQRSKEGLRATFVDQEQIFDYYNYGRYGPSGIQNAVRAVRPQYLLLAGRTTYDYRDYSGLGVDPMCPTFLVSTTFWAQATSDSMFGDLGRGFPEVAVGRLPVNTPAELSVAVKRIMSYSGPPSSGAVLHAVADRLDPETADFPAQAESLAQANPELTWQRNYLGVTYQTSPEVSSALMSAANGGANWILYVGHGNASRLGKDDPRILQTDSVRDNVQFMTGNVVLLQSTCTANWMAADQTVGKSIAIQALTQPQGGISASIAPSTYMASDYGVEFMGQLLKNANSGSARWGNALLNAQQWAYSKGAGFYADLSNTEQIFGDPAMPIMSKAAPNTAANTTTGATVPAGTTTTTGTTKTGGTATPGSTPTTTTPGSSVVPGQF